MIEKLRGLRLSRAAELVEMAIEETLAYYAFTEEHWRRIRTNNPLKRILREIRRRTRVVGAFPDGQSALNREAAPHRRHGVVCEEISIRDDRRAFLDASLAWASRSPRYLEALLN